MVLVRKLLGPPLLVLGFLLLLLVIPGHRTPAAQAESGKICRIDGPTILNVGQTALYAWRVEDNREDIYEDLESGPDDVAHVVYPDTLSVSLDNISGSSKLTGVLDDFKPPYTFDYDKYITESSYKQTTAPNNVLNNVPVANPSNFSDSLLSMLKKRFTYDVTGNPCGASVFDLLAECVRDTSIFINQLPGGCRNIGLPTEYGGTDANQRFAWANAIDAALQTGKFDCLSLMDIGNKALLRAGYVNQQGYIELGAMWLAFCDFSVPVPRQNFIKDNPTLCGVIEPGKPMGTTIDPRCITHIGPIIDDIGLVDVTCVQPGVFTLSIADTDQPGDSQSLTITCRGAPIAANLVTFPNVVDIVPTPGGVSHSLLIVTLTDPDGGVPTSGYKVDFSTDRCAIETGGIDKAEEIVPISQLFAAYNPVLPDSATAIESSPLVNATVDSDSQHDSTLSFEVGQPVTSRAAAIFSCNPKDAPGAQPGIANIQAVVQVPGGQDLVLTSQIAVVGPPAGINLTATPANVRCGEKIAIKVDIRDAANQFVSDLTRVEAVTNYGGVYAGTGAVANKAGPVVPISSTVAETFAGSANFFLLTSDLHTGPYQIVVTTGGGGGLGSNLGGLFSTPAQTVSVTVNCFLPTDSVPGVVALAAAPPTTAAPVSPTAVLAAPASGVIPMPAIRPPNTGSAGLADTHSHRIELLAATLLVVALSTATALRRRHRTA